MIQLRYLRTAQLYKTTKTRQSNGAIIETLTLDSTYKVARQEVSDEVSASVYGASIDKMLRITSVKYALEDFLQGKIDPTTNNITDYLIVMDNRKYRIVSAKLRWVDIEMVGQFTSPASL